MTLRELYNRAINAGFNYAFGVFKEKTKPPHLIAKTDYTENFIADNKIYLKIEGICLELTTETIRKDLEEKIENSILYDVCWEKTETTYIPEENIWNTSYFFNI